MSLADVIIPGLPKLASTALAPASAQRERWANRLNRAQGHTGKPCKIQYSHGSTGHYDIDGCFRPFGGPMLFSAWCACGRFRYHGEEQGRRYAVKAHKSWTALGVDDVVTYHGEQHASAEFVITAVNADDTVDLSDTAWGNTVLRDVNRAYLESAGRQWVARTCDCPRYLRRALDGSCSNYNCPASRKGRPS